MIVILIAALARGLTGDCGSGIEPQLSLGADLARNSAGDNHTAGTLALGVAWNLQGCAPIPLRTELVLGTSSEGPPWGKGVEAVEMRALHLRVAGLTGSGVVVHEGAATLGLEALLGPELEAVRAGITVQDNDSAAWGLHPRLRLEGGAYVEKGSLRFTVRFVGALPKGWPGVSMGVGVAL